MGKKRSKTVMQLAYASSIGLAMVISIFGSLYFGRYLDERFGTGLRYTIIFLLLGIAAGFRNLYKAIKKYSSDENSDTDSIESDSNNGKNTPSKKT